MTWKDRILQVLYPPRCPGCGGSVGAHGQWCPPCLAKIWRPRRIYRSAAVRHLDGCYCLTDYRGPMRRVLQRLKYNGALRYGAACHTLLAQFPWLDRMPPVSCVVPVPLAPEKERQRRFNQVEILFRSWVEVRWPWYDALQRIRPTRGQWQLNRIDRRDNVKRAFAVKGSFCAQKRHILLVDDIYTTGMTLDACAWALKRQGAATVTGLVIASDAP